MTLSIELIEQGIFLYGMILFGLILACGYLELQIKKLKESINGIKEQRE